MMKDIARTIGIYAGIILLIGFAAGRACSPPDPRIAQAEKDRKAAEAREDFWRPLANARKEKLKKSIKTMHVAADVYRKARKVVNLSDSNAVKDVLAKADKAVDAGDSVAVHATSTVAAQDSTIKAKDDKEKAQDVLIKAKPSRIGFSVAAYRDVFSKSYSLQAVGSFAVTEKLALVAGLEGYHDQDYKAKGLRTLEPGVYVGAEYAFR